jgi:hypothetical protein
MHYTAAVKHAKAFVKGGRFLCSKCQQPLGAGDPDENRVLDDCRTTDCPNNPDTSPRRNGSARQADARPIS